MKLFLAIFISLLTINTTMAQDNWTIKLNNKTVLKATGEEEAKNVVKVKKAQSKLSLSISIPASETAADWNRSVIIVGKKDAELWKQEIKGQLNIPTATLKKLAATNKTLKIYTIALPNDPDEAARVRVRRVHLCTLVFK